jgi:hypothetical protein
MSTKSRAFGLSVGTTPLRNCGTSRVGSPVEVAVAGAGGVIGEGDMGAGGVRAGMGAGGVGAGAVAGAGLGGAGAADVGEDVEDGGGPQS